MPYKPTGRPRGRPSKNPIEAAKRKVAIEQSVAKRLHNAQFVAEVFNVTDAEALAFRPKDLFPRLVLVAIKAGDHQELRALARDWAPYEHARVTEHQLTPEEIRQLGNMARSEASRRGYDLTDTPGPAEGTMPN